MSGPGHRDPRPRDVVRRDGGCARHARTGEIRANVVASQADLHARYGGVVPEVASRRHLELVAPVVREALARGGRDARRRRPRRRHAGPGPDRRAARRALRREGARVGAAAAARPGRPPPRPRRLALPRSRTPLEPPFLCLLASGGHTLLLDVASHRRTARPRHDARRRRRRGVRQGRAAARPRLPRRRASSTGSRARATRPRTTSPSRACPGSTSPSPASRPRSSTRRASSRPRSSSARRADLAASLPAGDRPRARRARRGRRRAELGATRIAVVGGVAANSELRAALADAALAPLALCTDNAAMIASAARFTEPVPYPGYLGLDAFASR